MFFSDEPYAITGHLILQVFLVKQTSVAKIYISLVNAAHMLAVKFALSEC